MNKWLFLLLLPSLAFAERPASLEMRKDPVYVDVEPQKVVIYPEKAEITAATLATPRNEFEKFLDQVKQVRAVRYPVLVLRPGSVELHRQLRQMIQTRGLDVGFEPVETGQDMLQAFLDNVPDFGIRRLSLAMFAVSFELSARRSPCTVEVRTNSLIILTNGVVVTGDDLPNPGNAFDKWLDQCKDDCPAVFCKQPGSEKLYAQIMLKLYERNQRTWAVIDKLGAPIEVPANGRAPVYLECRDNRLFAVAADAPAREFEISILNSLDPATQYICLLVRPDSFDIFRKASKAAWEHGLDISCEQQDSSSPLAIGPEGKPIFPQ